MKTTAYLDFIHHVRGDLFRIEGYIGGAAPNFEKMTIQVGDKELQPTFVARTVDHDASLHHAPIEGSAFEVECSVGSSKSSLEVRIGDARLPIRANVFTGLTNLSVSYKVFGDYMWVLCLGRMWILPKTKATVVLFELLTYASIVVNIRLPELVSRVTREGTARTRLTEGLKGLATTAEAIVDVPRALLLRTLYWITKSSKKRPIWLLSDRVTSAGDNGEALLAYINERDDVPADTHFILSKKSPDYARVAQYGSVVAYGSIKHLLLFLKADKIVSSHADTETINPFMRLGNRYSGLFSFKFVFLQHGIIRHDLSSWLNRFNKNIHVFVTSSTVEKKSILEKPYYYSEDQVLLSGLPRYDRLQSNPSGKLILAPTYRAGLVTGRVSRSGERSYDPAFKESEYYDFYNRFMNDSRVVTALMGAGMTAEFYLHPTFKAQADDFEENETFRVAEYPYDYNAAFETGSMLVSDHSSVVFDFAYLRKPVLYAYFDADTFYDQHVYSQSDFFKDKKDGFGPVCDDYESLVHETVKMVTEGCTMKQIYKKRVEQYFAFKDQQNSARVYHALLKDDA